MNSQLPTDHLGSRNHWRKVLWVVLFILMILAASRLAGALAPDASQAAEAPAGEVALINCRPAFH